MARLRFDDQSGAAAGNAFTVGASSSACSWVSAPSFPTIASPDYAVIVAEPNTPNEEIMYLTAYTNGATTGTVTRLAEVALGGAGTAIAHTSVAWLHGPTALDYPGAQVSAAAVAVANVTQSGTAAMDGYSIVTGDVVLLTDQSSAVNNGLWRVASGSWTRPNLFPSGALVGPRACSVVNGSIYANTQWLLDAPTGGITVDTSSQTWTQQIGATAIVPITSQSGTAYTLALTDAGTLIESTNASPVVFTIPTNASVAFPIGTQIVCMQAAAGPLTIAYANPPLLDGVSAVNALWGTVVLTKVATDTWVGVGAAADPVNAVSPAGSTQTLLAGYMNRYVFTASTSCTFTLPPAIAGSSFTAEFVQASSGSAATPTITSADYGAAGTPTWSTVNNKRDIVVGYCSDGSTWQVILAGVGF